jgi:hypothetical protein
LSLLADAHRDESAADNDSKHKSRDKILHFFSSHIAPASGYFFRLRRDTASPKGTVFVKRRLRYLCGSVPIFAASDRPVTPEDRGAEAIGPWKLRRAD